jgi:calcium homeostasis ER protein
MTKMGWSGRGGLGTSEQGIVDPVAHAEVRDRQDMFKGIGLPMDDPFEQFRKNRSQGFTARMKEKAEIALEKAAAITSSSHSPSPPPA